MRQSFTLTPDELETTKKEVLDLTQKVLAEKDYWLQIHGSLQENQFHCAWSAALTVCEITSVEILSTYSDVMLQFTTDTALPLKAILRWGKGQGLSNLRMDLK